MRNLVLFCILLATLRVAGNAQNATGTLAGTVRDPSNSVLPSAQVTVTNEDTGLTRKVNTSGEGEFRVPFLPVGSYVVRVQKEGFKTQVQNKIRLEILQVRAVDFSLQLGAV
ncbi:MAG: carboxypeptidase-like regulatory domain-containing protein, partial [Bryobacteraceae bacterium]